LMMMKCTVSMSYSLWTEPSAYASAIQNHSDSSREMDVNMFSILFSNGISVGVMIFQMCHTHVHIPRPLRPPCPALPTCFTEDWESNKFKEEKKKFCRVRYF
jgi:hypothetical protein